MAKRKIDENLMKEMVSKGFNRRPGTPTHKNTSSEDPLDSLPLTSNEVPNKEIKSENNKERYEPNNIEQEVGMDMERYSSLFLQPIKFTDRSNFSIHRKTLNHLRAVLEDTGRTTTLTGLIENILNHHLHEYKELINKSTAKNIRKQTLTNL